MSNDTIKFESTVQDLLIADFLEAEDNNGQNETVELLEFMKNNSVPLTENQVMGMLLLKEFDLQDISNYVLNVRRYMTPFQKFMKIIDSMTMGSRIKGNAKLKDILKANANPANTAVPMHAEAMKKSEIGG